MKAQFLSFNADADRVCVNSTIRAKVIAAALAKALSDLAQLPTSQVDSPSNYFNMQVSQQLRNTISVWNENLVFDTRYCMELVRTFWLLRYTAAHPTSRPIYNLDYDFFSAATGVPTYVSKDLAEFLNENKKAVLFLAASAAIIVQKDREAENG